MHARSIRVRGVVQGVGFRPFVYRLAHTNRLYGWVLNQEDGVEIHVEGPAHAIETFVRSLQTDAPPAARISSVDITEAGFPSLPDFVIRESHRTGSPSVRISPDLPVCSSCLNEL